MIFLNRKTIPSEEGTIVIFYIKEFYEREI